MKHRFLYLAVLIFFSLLCFWPGQTSIPPIDRDEARFAQASRQMVASGDYVDIRFQAEPRYRKPIGIYWLQSLAVAALGEDPNNPIWPYRLPSLLGALSAVLATYGLGKTLLDRQAGFIAALLLATSLLLNIQARLATVDAVLLLCSTLALWGVARVNPLSNHPNILSPSSFAEATEDRPPASRSFSVGKVVEVGERESHRTVMVSPPALFFTTSPLTPQGEGMNKSGISIALLFWLALAAGILLKGPVILLVVGLPILCAGQPRATLKALHPAWGIPLLLALLTPWFVLITRQSHGAFWAEALGHDLGDKLTQGREHHSAWPGTYLLELPLAFWPASPLVLAALPLAWRQRRDPRLRFLLAAILPAWLMFEAVPTKLPHYVLPLFPPLAVLTAIIWREAPGRLWRCVRDHQAKWLGGLAALALIADGIGFGLVLPRLTTPFIIREFVRHRAAYSADLRTGTVVLAGFHEPSAVLYLGTGTELLAGPAAAAALAAGTVALALITPDEAAPFANPIFTPVETIDGYNYARGRSVRLTVYRKKD